MSKDNSLQAFIKNLKSSNSKFKQKKAEMLIQHLRFWGDDSVKIEGENVYLFAPPGAKKIDTDIRLPEFKLNQMTVSTDSQRKVLNELIKWKIGMIGIYIYGKCGSGKTTLLEAFADKQRKVLEGVDVRFFTYSELVKGLINRKEKRMLSSKSMRQSREVTIEEWYLYHAKNTGVLIIDDFLSNDFPFHPVENLQEILDFRIKMNLPTFLSSNIKIKDILTNVNERIGDRLLKLTKSMECHTDESYRLKSQRGYHNND